MKSFRNYISEEVLPSVQVADGGLDIEKPAVRAAINAAIAGVVSQPAVTPYVVYNRLSKLLAQYHIVLPKRFLEGDKGVEVFEVKQFGHKMGMTDSGEFINQVPSTHYLFLQYGIITPMGVTYAKPIVGGMFRVTARLVDKEELDKLLDMAEITMAEEAECRQMSAKAMAPKEPMHDVTSDEKKKGNKAAVATSEKDLSEERKRTASVADAFMKGQKANQRTLRTDGKSITYHGNTIAKHEGDEVHVTTAGHSHSPSTRGHINGVLSRLGSDKLSVKKGQLHHGKNPVDHDSWIKVKKPEKATFGEEKNDLAGACWKGYTAKGLKKKGGKMVPNCVPVEEEKGDRLTPQTMNNPTGKDKTGASERDRGITFVPKNTKDNDGGMPQNTLKPEGKFTNRVDPEGRKNEYAPGGTMYEKLTKKMSAGDVISDFVHSKAKTFEGDTKKKRIKRALGAYYSKQRSE